MAADASRRSAVPMFLRTPKGQLLCFLGVLFILAAPGEGIGAVLPGTVAAIVAAVGVDAFYTYWETRRWIVPTGALLSGLIVAFVLGTQEPWQVFAWVAGFASVTKHVFRGDREHFFNPAALALLGSAVLFGSGQSWWGALGNIPAPFALVLIISGAYLVDRLNKFPLVLAFLGTYFTAFALASIMDSSAVAEMFRAPFLQAALFLAFFMLTDPPTSPNQIADQVWYGLVAAIVAFVAQIMGVGQTYLLVGVLVANVWLAVRRWLARRPPKLTGVDRRRVRRAAMARSAPAHV